MVDVAGRAAVCYGCELIEEGTRKALSELTAEVMCFGQILFGEFPQALFSVNAHEHRGHQRDESLVGTDVRRGLFAANVLLARSQGQAEGAVTARITGFADQPARHLAN